METQRDVLNILIDRNRVEISNYCIISMLIATHYADPHTGAVHEGVCCSARTGLLISDQSVARGDGVLG